LVASGQRDPAVRVGEHQQRPTVDIGCVAGLELAGQHVKRTQGTLGPVGGGVVAAVQVRGPAGEPAAAEFVVFLALEVSVQATRCLAFSQVNEGFHYGSRVATAFGTAKTESDITFPSAAAQGQFAVFVMTSPARRSL